MTTPEELQLDRPVKGDINLGYSGAPARQYSPAEFLAEIDSAFENPAIKGLIWEQYTPYFNDGEPCEFSVNEVRVLLTLDEDEDSEEDEDDYREYERGYSTYDVYDTGSPYRDNLDSVGWKELPGGVSGRVVYEALQTFNTSAWETVARANFGDHAQVIATREGFEVEGYDHD